MKLEELEKLQSTEIENLARLIVDEIEKEADIQADKDAEGYEPPISFDQLDTVEKAAILAAAKTIYEKISYEPFYRYIQVEYASPEIEEYQPGEKKDGS